MTNSSQTSSGVSHRNSRPGSADSRNSWLNMSRSTKTFKEHSIDKSVKRIDAIIEKDTCFIQSLEQKVVDREIARKQASELLNKRWNDSVYRVVLSKSRLLGADLSKVRQFTVFWGSFGDHNAFLVVLVF